MKIVDPALMPYEIVLDGSNHTVEELTSKLNKDHEPIYKNHGYFNSIEYAVAKIISLKLIDSNKSVTLTEFIQEYRDIKDKIKEAIKF
jgi:hypothetical protein